MWKLSQNSSILLILFMTAELFLSPSFPEKEQKSSPRLLSLFSSSQLQKPFVPPIPSGPLNTCGLEVDRKATELVLTILNE